MRTITVKIQEGADFRASGADDGTVDLHSAAASEAKGEEVARSSRDPAGALEDSDEYDSGSESSFETSDSSSSESSCSSSYSPSEARCLRTLSMRSGRRLMFSSPAHRSRKKKKKRRKQRKKKKRKQRSKRKTKKKKNKGKAQKKSKSSQRKKSSRACRKKASNSRYFPNLPTYEAAPFEVDEVLLDVRSLL